MPIVISYCRNDRAVYCAGPYPRHARCSASESVCSRTLRSQWPASSANTYWYVFEHGGHAVIGCHPIVHAVTHDVRIQQVAIADLHPDADGFARGVGDDRE